MAVRYRHTQLGVVVLIVVGLAAAGIIVPAFFVRMPVSALAVAGVLLVCLGLFAAMTVDVSDRRIAVRFDPGAICAELMPGEVRSVRVVRNQWYMGCGVRQLPRGWLYNVSGLDALEVEMTGGKIHRIGPTSLKPWRLRYGRRRACRLTPMRPPFVKRDEVAGRPPSGVSEVRIDERVPT